MDHSSLPEGDDDEADVEAVENSSSNGGEGLGEKHFAGFQNCLCSTLSSALWAFDLLSPGPAVDGCGNDACSGEERSAAEDSHVAGEGGAEKVLNGCPIWDRDVNADQYTLKSLVLNQLVPPGEGVDSDNMGDANSCGADVAESGTGEKQPCPLNLF